MPRKKSAPVRKQVSSSLSSSADTGASSLNGPGNFVSFATAAAAADAAANLSPRHECHPMVTAPLLKSAAQETADAALDEYTLLAFWELPSWLQNNPHIKTGYRAKFTMRLTLLSLFRMHNETLNVWTHLLGFLLVLGIIISNTYGYWESSWLDKAIFYVFWFSALLCLAASTLYHWMHCYSARACYNLALVDYCSIAVLVVGSFYPTIYYGFAHGRFWQVLYLSAITVFGSVGIIGPFFPRFHEPEFRVIRTLLFTGTAAFGIIPTVHAHWLIPEWDILLRIYAMFASYGVGTLIFALRIPERWWPGKFDLLCSSHQLWHCFVVGGIWFHHTLCVRLYERWMERGWCEAHDLLSLT